MSKKLTTEEFIEKANRKHNNKYDYSKVEYINNHTEVVIECPIHGEFKQIPNSHLNGCGCPQCANEKRIESKRMPLENFIVKANKKHNFKYDYSKVEYINTHTEVVIKCPIHGEFKQTPAVHLKGHGCPQCAIEKNTKKQRMPLENFIAKANKKHNFKYDYSKVEYINSHTEILIVCPIHGEFCQKPTYHLSGHGCPQCAIEKNTESKRMTREEFIKRANRKHHNKYDYSKIEYKNSHTEVVIKCPIHGEFKQTPAVHLKGHGCPKCAIEKNAENQRITYEEFIERANEKHHNKYDYSKVEYINSDTEVVIKCPIHGEFCQKPTYHLSGHGCPKCAIEKSAESKRMSYEEFIERANEKHHNKYDYSKVEYINCNTEVIIKCPIHGEFKQTPAVHLIGCGCQRCSESHLENNVNNFLNEYNIIFEIQKKFKELGNQSYDFYIPSLNTLIECQGIQHFEYSDFFHSKRGFEYEEERDLNKYNFAIKNGYKILYYTNVEKYDTFLGEPLIKDLDTLKSVLTSFNK